MKAKISVTAAQLGKLPVAGELSNVTPGKVTKLADVIKVEVDTKDPGNLFTLGQRIDKVTDTDVKAFEEMKAEEKKIADAKAKAKTGNK